MRTLPSTKTPSLQTSSAPALSSMLGAWWETALGQGSVRALRAVRQASDEKDAGSDAACAEWPTARLVAGAFAHLARHLESDCPQAAGLAAMLLARVADDPDAGPHLREQAYELAESLERKRALQLAGGREGRFVANGCA